MPFLHVIFFKARTQYENMQNKISITIVILPLFLKLKALYKNLFYFFFWKIILFHKQETNSSSVSHTLLLFSLSFFPLGLSIPSRQVQVLRRAQLLLKEDIHVNSMRFHSCTAAGTRLQHCHFQVCHFYKKETKPFSPWKKYRNHLITYPIVFPILCPLSSTLVHVSVLLLLFFFY
jgi:hypothetical protein